MATLTVPSTKTLDKYGLSRLDWISLAMRQGGVCGVCGKLPESGRLNVDHDHVRGYKKMSQVQKRLYVRGLLCYVCNKFFAMRGMTEEKACKLVKYLASYAERRVNG